MVTADPKHGYGRSLPTAWSPAAREAQRLAIDVDVVSPFTVENL